MAKVLFVLLLSTLVLSACSSATPPAESGQNTTPPAGDQQIIIGLATIEHVDILILESFPVQIHVQIKGMLGDGCTTLGEITQTREETIFRIKVTTERPAEAMCIQILTPFDETVALDVLGLPAGVYTVDVNGVQDTFTLDIDNVAP